MANQKVTFGGDTSGLLPGTIIFLVLGVLSCVISVFTVRAKTKQEEYKKDNACIAVVCCCIATFCMWTMWICTYMNQMNPILYPQVARE